MKTQRTAMFAASLLLLFALLSGPLLTSLATMTGVPAATAAAEALDFTPEASAAGDVSTYYRCPVAYRCIVNLSMGAWAGATVTFSFQACDAYGCDYWSESQDHQCGWGNCYRDARSNSYYDASVYHYYVNFWDDRGGVVGHSCRHF